MRNRAVSPVIGVVLMVSITVLLAAVVGIFVIPLADSSSQPPSSTTLTIEESPDTNSVKIVHTGGSAIDPANLNVLSPDADLSREGTETGDDQTIDAGESINVSSSSLKKDDKILVQWSSDNGQSTLLLEDTLDKESW